MIMIMIMIMMMSSELASGLRRWLNGLRGSPSAQPGTVIPSAQTATTPKTSSRSASSTSPKPIHSVNGTTRRIVPTSTTTASRRVVNECFFSIQCPPSIRNHMMMITPHSQKKNLPKPTCFLPQVIILETFNQQPPPGSPWPRTPGCVPGVIRVPKTKLEHPSLATKAWH